MILVFFSCFQPRTRIQEPKFALRAPCACPSGHFLGYWPPWGGTRSREPRKPRKALKTLHPSQERVPRGAHMVPPYFQGAESVFGLNLLHFHGFRGANGALRGINLIRGTTMGRRAGRQDGQTIIFFSGLQARPNLGPWARPTDREFGHCGCARRRPNVAALSTSSRERPSGTEAHSAWTPWWEPLGGLPRSKPVNEYTRQLSTNLRTCGIRCHGGLSHPGLHPGRDADKAKMSTPTWIGPVEEVEAGRGLSYTNSGH